LICSIGADSADSAISATGYFPSAGVEK